MDFDPNLFVAKWLLKQVGSEDVPGFAADALEAGFDGPALRVLAGLIRPDTLDVAPLFPKALDEIGIISIQTKREAIFKLARLVARKLLDGDMEPFEAANRLSYYALIGGYPPGLAEFDQLADEPKWGEFARPRDVVNAEIIEQARKLLELPT